MFAIAISVSSVHVGLKSRDAFLQLLTLKRLLSKLEYALRRPDADVLMFTVQVLHQSFGRLGDIGLEAIQCAINEGIALAL